MKAIIYYSDKTKKREILFSGKKKKDWLRIQKQVKDNERCVECFQNCPLSKMNLCEAKVTKIELIEDIEPTK